MRYLKKFENYKLNEEVTGIGLLVGLGLSLVAPSLYQKAKQFWSKHMISEKYKPTGQKETLICELPDKISPTAILTTKEKDSGQVKIDLIQYQDDFGNVYWGYDHLWSPEVFSDFTEYVQSCNVWTAIFKESDYDVLKSFLQNGDRYRAFPIKETGNKVFKPKPVEMVFRKDLSSTEFGNN